jgi:hypothetical protein
MEHLVKHGHVSVWGPVTARGNKRNRQLHVEVRAVAHPELIARHLGWIKAAAEGKAAKADHYGRSHVLVIAFEDFFELGDSDIACLRSFITEHVLTLSLNFSALFLVGMSGTTFLTFPLSSNTDE